MQQEGFMSETANNIVQWLYSNDVALIKKAFKVYTPHLEGAVKKAFEQRSDDLKDIGFSDLACNTIYLDGFFIRDDLSRIVEIEIDGALRDVYLVQPQDSTVEFKWTFDQDSKPFMAGLLSCLKGNCWLQSVFPEDFGAEGKWGDIVAFYLDTATSTIHILNTQGNQRGNLKPDDVSCFSLDFAQSCQNMSIEIDDEFTTDTTAYVPLLYFFCMKAGLQYNSVKPCVLPFNPSEPIEKWYADQNVDWKTVNSSFHINLSPFWSHR